MYLTRMELDLTNRRVLRALASPSVIHGAVESAFSGERQRNLWRVDRLRGKTYLMLLSPEIPDMTSAHRQLGVPNADPPWETKCCDRLLDSIQTGHTLYFRLTANPTYSLSRGRDAKGAKPRGQVHAHKTIAHQRQWLIKRGESCGFRLNDGDFDVRESGWRSFKKGKDGGRSVKIMAATFEGRLTVTDAAAFRYALTNGIGRARAYGMGMMTVIRGAYSSGGRNDG